MAANPSGRTNLRVAPTLTRPIGAVHALDLAKAPWVTHARSLPSTAGRSVIVVADDGSLSIVDKQSGGVSWKCSSWKEGGKVNELRVADGCWITAGSKGVVGLWDARSGSTSASMLLRGPHGGSYLSVAAESSTNPNIIAAGCELQGSDANLDIWDRRSPHAPIFTYNESHSDDITSLSFSDKHPSILISGASDGLIASYDLSIGSSEDDAVVAVGNTGASIARIGWGGAPAGIGTAFVPQGESDQLDGEPDEQPRRGLGCAWGISDMQTLSIWDTDRFDQIMAPTDCKQPYSHQPPWETDYIIDACDAQQSGIAGLSDGVVLFTGAPNGGIAITHAPSPTTPSKQAGAATGSWSLLGLFPAAEQVAEAAGGKAHSDIVRCFDLDVGTQTVTTGGEDGRVCIWNLADAQSDSATMRSSLPAMASAEGVASRVASGSGGARDRNSPLGAQSRNRYKPYG